MVPERQKGCHIDGRPSSGIATWSGGVIGRNSMPSYYRARYYDPNTGRFLSEDSIGFEAGANFYEYGGDNPADLTDPFGLQSPLPPGCSPPFLTPCGPPLYGPPLGLPPKPQPPAVPSWWPGTGPGSGSASKTGPAPAPQPAPAAGGQGGCPKDPCDPSNFPGYAQDAAAPAGGKGPISNAGRSLQKHSGRGQGFPTPNGPPSAINSVAQTLIEEILTNPQSKCTTGKSPRQGDYVQIRLPNGIGARWTLNGQFIGFIGP